MIKQFEWYFQPTDEEIKEIWKNAIFTVDTNVMLDLYRYHEDTRKNILDALENFKDQIWLSHQVANEFLKNRMTVIIESKNSIDKVENYVLDFEQKEIGKLIKTLRENRMISKKEIDDLETNFATQFNSLTQMIKSLRDQYPDFKNNDDVLKKLLEIFDSNIGQPFEEKEFAKEEKIASERFSKKIPPGYEDVKNKDYPYGDYFVWRQVINHAKTQGRPLIFITSEKKEDWWEIRSGQTVGPRLELKKEFFDETNQRIFIYRTDRFIEYYSQMFNLPVNHTVLQEIRDVSSERVTKTVVTLNEDILNIQENYQTGILTIELQKDVYRFTCSGHININFDQIPKVEANLIESPSDCPSDIYIGSGSGTTFDFHIHIKSNEYNITLPRGIYKFEYELFT